MTGDDALELAGAGRLAAGPALGVNLRASAYTGLESGLAGQIASAVAAAAAEGGLPMRGLPMAEATAMMIIAVASCRAPAGRAGPQVQKPAW